METGAWWDEDGFWVDYYGTVYGPFQDEVVAEKWLYNLNHENGETCDRY